MKRYKFLVLPFFVVFVLASCILVEEPLGKWSDNIHLSQKSADFNAEGDSIVITTGGDWWWVVGITINDSSYYDFMQEIDVTTEQYTIQEDCFVVERRNKNTLFIKMDANPERKIRVMKVELEAGDYFTRVFINQKGTS